MAAKKEIFIKLTEVEELVSIMKEIKEKEDKIKTMFKEYDTLSVKEGRLSENWPNNFAEVMNRLDHVIL